MTRILMLAQKSSANTNHWVDSLTRFGPAEVEVWSMPERPAWYRFLTMYGAIRDVRRRIMTFQPDVVVAYRTTSYGFIGAMSGFSPLVLAAQGESDVWPPGHWSNRIISAMARYAIGRASLIHAWGNGMVPALLKLGAPKDIVLILPRGIDTELFLFNAPFSVPNQVTFIVSRALYPEYHHDILIEAFAAVVKRFPELTCRLVIAGEGPLNSKLILFAEQLGVSRFISFVGKLDPKALSLQLREADIYLSLPETEGVSASLLEAMASGCIPVVTDLAANRDWITDHEHGRLVALDTASVENAIVSILQRKEFWREIAASNRSLVIQRADARRNAAKFVERYRILIAGREATR